MNTGSGRVVVLTGGPGAGKTTLLDALAARGHAVVAEAAIQVIGQLVDELGSVDACSAWRRANTIAFQLRIARMQVALEAEARGGASVVFCDRGLIDGLAYLRHRGVTPPDELLHLIEQTRYDGVYLLETLSSFDPRPETGRVSRREDSIALGGLLRSVYRERGYDVVDVPERPIDERVDLVLDRLASGAPRS